MFFDQYGNLLVSVANTNANGQATSANSSPVVLPSDYVAPVKSVRQEVIGNGPGVVNAANTDLIASTDTTGFTCAVLQLAGVWTAVLQAQQCNDNANFLQTQLWNAQTLIAATGLTNSINSTNGLYVIPLSGRYLKVRCTGWTSNASLVATLELYTTPPPFVLAALATYATLAPQTSGGTSDYHLISAASTNAGVVKNAQGQVYGYDIYNSNAAARYVKLFNKTTAPTVGTDVPIRTIGVPPGGRASYHNTMGIQFATGIAIATTTGAADNDSGAVGANDLAIEIDYK